MSLAIAVALAFSPTATLPSCSWDRPGHDPFMGDVVQAVERYTNIPLEVRDRLKQRMAKRQYDEIVTIGRDSITGIHRYSPEIRDMHFGQGRVCRSVSRSGWAPNAVERGLVYCEGEHCIIVPTVCRNVSRITRLPPPTGNALSRSGTRMPETGLTTDGGGAPPDGKGVQLAANTLPDTTELLLDPTSAGMPRVDGAQMAVQGVLAAIPPTSGLLVEPPSTFAGGSSPSGPRIDFNPYPIIPGGGGGIFPTPVMPPVEISRPPDPVLPPAPPGIPIDPPSPLPLFPPIPEILPTEVPGVPEPGTWALMAAGVAALLARRRAAARLRS